MGASRFDRLTRSLATASSRRRLLRGLATLGLAAGIVADRARAKKRKQKFKLNDFGCVNVGGKCRGKNSVCCSGICQGKKPKKGKKDKSKCVAHDATSCLAGQHSIGCGVSQVGCTTSAGEGGVCETTTGDAGYCRHQLGCVACSRDADCRPFCGAQAACIQCANCATGTACGGPGGGPGDCFFA